MYTKIFGIILNFNQSTKTNSYPYIGINLYL